MKRSALYTSIAMVVLIVCCLTAVTYSFFTSHSGNTIFELGSAANATFTIIYDQTKEQKIAGANANETGRVAFWVIDYNTGGIDYRNMYFTMSELQYKLTQSQAKNATEQSNFSSGVTNALSLSPGMVIDKDSANAKYMDGILEFAFFAIPREGVGHFKIEDAEKDNYQAVVDKIGQANMGSLEWSTKKKMSLDCFKLDAIPGKTDTNEITRGQIVLFIRIKENIDNELVPPAMNGVQVIATIESTEL